MGHLRTLTDTCGHLWTLLPTEPYCCTCHYSRRHRVCGPDVSCCPTGLWFCPRLTAAGRVRDRARTDGCCGCVCGVLSPRKQLLKGQDMRLCLSSGAAIGTPLLRQSECHIFCGHGRSIGCVGRVCACVGGFNSEPVPFTGAVVSGDTATLLDPTSCQQRPVNVVRVRAGNTTVPGT